MDLLDELCKGAECSTVFSGYQQVECPSDVLTDGSISHAEFPETISEGCVIPVTVRNANSPSKFWINLPGASFSERLNVLYKDLEEFYEKEHENYHLPSSAIIPGHFCVCLYAKKWTRAKILEVVHSNLVGVFFIDYGGTVFLTNDSLRFMVERFSIVPIQCFRADIHALIPKNTAEWPSDVCEYFRKQVSGKKVSAKVERLFTRSYTLSVTLMDSGGTNITNLLIGCGLAQVNYLSTSNLSVKDVGDNFPQAVTQSPLCVNTGSWRQPLYSGNHAAERPIITCKDVTVAGYRLLLVTFCCEQYFVFSEFVSTFAELHEHVALKVLATLAEHFPIWKLEGKQVNMFTKTLAGLSFGRLERFRRGAGAPPVHLLPVTKATEVMNLLHIDDTQTDDGILRSRVTSVGATKEARISRSLKSGRKEGRTPHVTR